MDINCIKIDNTVSPQIKFPCLCKNAFEKKRKNLLFSKKMEQVFKDCNSNHVFKKCHDNLTDHDCIVMLEKPLSDFICNESRDSVKNKEMAKFRCNGLNVVLIYDLVLQQTMSQILHQPNYWGLLTYYKIGEIVKPDRFDDDLDIVCTSGIHYFLTLKAAMSYDFEEGCCMINGILFGHDGKERKIQGPKKSEKIVYFPKNGTSGRSGTSV
jgi:hypothetical protein